MTLVHCDCTDCISNENGQCTGKTIFLIQSGSYFQCDVKIIPFKLDLRNGTICGHLLSNWENKGEYSQCKICGVMDINYIKSDHLKLDEMEE